MSTTYDWKITQLERKLSTGHVFLASYEIIGTDGQYSHKSMGSIRFDMGEIDENFIPFEELAEDTIVKWIKDLRGSVWVTDQENYVGEQIEIQKCPVNAYGLPWSGVNQVVPIEEEVVVEEIDEESKEESQETL